MGRANTKALGCLNAWVSTKELEPGQSGYYWVDFDDHDFKIGWFEKSEVGSWWEFVGCEDQYPHGYAHPYRFLPVRQCHHAAEEVADER